VSAFEFARDGISEVFAHCGCDVRRSFAATEAELNGSPDEKHQVAAD
jgi:hypothetical protein